MADTLGTSYAAQSLGMTQNNLGGPDIARLLRDELAEQAKKRQRREPATDAIGSRVVSPAAFDLLGTNPSG